MSPTKSYKARPGAIFRKRAAKSPAHDLSKLSKSSLDFCEFVAGEVQRACDPHVETDEDLKFVPYCVLKRYWNRETISEVFREQKLYFTVETILTRYLRLFSLLVYTGQTQHLAYFTAHNLGDAKLPLSSFPSEWPTKTKVFRRLWDSISRDQWMFFPLVVNTHELEDLHLDGRVVVPIVSREEIARGNAASVEIVTVHDGCNFPSVHNSPSPCFRSFALKTYHTESSRSTYENEIRALRMFSNYPSPNIVKYEGSFRHHGTHKKHETYNVIMEHIGGGDLSNFFKTRSPPKADEVSLFWKSLSRILNGLQRIHHLVEGNSEVFGMHEDIKPDNILISFDMKSRGYVFVPKIVDFGLFSRVTRSISSSSTAMGSNTQGNQMYSSPESSFNELHTEKGNRGPVMVTPKADVFSMAAVLSAACAWVAGGRDLQKRYSERRKAYHDGLPRFQGKSFKGCFHDGHKCIPTVYEMHEEIRDICKGRKDEITPAVLDILEKLVFKKETPSERSSASDILVALNDLFDETSSRAEPDDDSTECEMSDTDATTPADGSLADLGRGMTIQYLASSRRGGQTKGDPRIKALVNRLKVNLPIRDHFFLIDDSRSMKEHVPLIKEALHELFVITKDLDPNKVELAFASAPALITQTSRRVNKLLHAVEKNQFQRESDMLDFFPRFLDEVIKPRLPRLVRGFDLNFKARVKGRKPISIYVFTDGNWGYDAGPGGGLKKPLEDLIKEMQHQKLGKQHVTFHFVRFGDNKIGKRYLAHLDRFGQNLNGWDIVDVKDLSNAEVHTIIIGPLSPVIDVVGEDDDD